MTAQEFNRYLGQPHLLYELPLSELQKLALRFPYSPNIRLLLLLKSHLEEHPEKEAYLSRCAAAAFDRPHIREVLRELDVDVQQAEVPQAEVLELKELDELELEPVLAGEPSVAELPGMEMPPYLVEDTDEKTPTTAPPEERAAEPAPFSEEVSPESPALMEPRPEKSPKVSTVDAPQRSPRPVSRSLGERLARIRRLQEVRTRDRNKEDVNRIARRSLVAHEEVASETLAGLLVRQGQYQNAIRMYQRLILLYPDKKTIFAGLIKDLKEKL